MKKMITKFSIHKTALTLALFHVFFGLFIGFVLLVVTAAQGHPLIVGIITLAALPVIYGVLGYLFVALFCWLYNLIAGKGTLGITFEVKDVD